MIRQCTIELYVYYPRPNLYYEREFSDEISQSCHSDNLLLRVLCTWSSLVED